MLHDEQHFVVRGRQRVLGVQDLVQVQVVAIAHVFAEIELGALFMHNGFGLAVGVSHGVWGYEAA
ncbi:hypothetical protein D3C71_1977800 [compost metagenome]